MTQNGTCHQVVIGGSGGRGILTMGRILAEAGMSRYPGVSYFANYGAAMRGGDSEVTVILSDKEISSPTVLRPETVIAMSPAFFKSLLPRVQSGGICLVDKAVITDEADRKDVNLHIIPATSRAMELGNVQVANLILLGAYLEATSTLPLDVVEEALERRLLSKRREALLPLNKQALHDGANMMAASIGR